MKKKKKNLMIGSVLILVLLVVYAGVSFGIKKSEQKKSDTAENTELFSIDSSEISSISFMGIDGEITFEQKDGNWSYPQDDAFVMKQSKIDDLLNDLYGVTYGRKLEQIEKLDEYGLGADKQEVKVVKTDGSELTIQIGIKNASTNEVYISLNGDTSTVYTVAKNMDIDFSGKVVDFAEYEVFPAIKAVNLREIQVKKPEDSYNIHMTGTSDCTVESIDGTVQEANLDIIGSVQESFTGIYWKKNIEYNCRDLKNYGLDNPQAVITAVWADSSEEKNAVNQVVVSVGKQDDEGNYYVRIDDSMQVHVVSEDRIGYLVEESAENFWSLTYSFVSIGDLNYLEATYEDKTYTLKKADESYYVDDKEVDAKLFNSFYYDCASVTAQERLTEVPAHEDEPALELHYYLTDGTEILIKYYEYDQNFYEVLYENDTKAGHTNKLYVNTMIEDLKALTNQ